MDAAATGATIIKSVLSGPNRKELTAAFYAAEDWVLLDSLGFPNFTGSLPTSGVGCGVHHLISFQLRLTEES